MERTGRRLQRPAGLYYIASAAAFFATSQIAQLWTIGPGGVQPFFPAVGAVVAVAFISPRNHALAIAASGTALGALASGSVDGLSGGDSAIYAISYSIEAAIGLFCANLVTRRLARGSALTPAVWLAACVTASVVGALVAVAGLKPTDDLEFALEWVQANTMGMFLVSSTPLAFRALDTVPSRRFANLEIGLAVALLAAATVGAFATATSVAFIILPVLTWVCLRGGTRYGLPSALAIVIYACVLTAAGHGPFTNDPPGWFTPLTGFIVAIGVSAGAMNLFAERAELRRIQINAILSAMPDAVVVVDRAGRVVASNTLGQPIHHGHDYDPNNPSPEYDTRREGNEPPPLLGNSVKQARAVDVDIRTVQSTGRIIESRRVDVGDGTRLSVVRDITDLVEMARQIDESDERWRRIIEAAREGIIEIDTTGEIRYASERFYEIVGWATDSLIGTELRDLIDESSMPAALAAGVNARSGAVVANEVKLVTAAGGKRWTLMSASPQLDDDGQMTCLTVFVTDITELKLAEVERIEMTDQLADVESSEQSRLARDLHDGPLQDLTAVQLILAHLSAKDGPDAELVNKASAAMVDALIALRTGVHALEPVDVMNGSLAEALQRHAIRAKGASELDVEVEQVGTPPLGSQAQVLYRIGREAITNATRHAVASTIRISIDGSEDHYVLRVADDGQGFAGDPTPLTGHIGLRSIRERAQRAHGSLNVESAAGHGTVVEVTLPAKPGASVD